MCECGGRQRFGALALLLIVMGSGGCTSFHSGTPVEGSCAELMRYWSHINTFGHGGTLLTGLGYGGVQVLLDPGLSTLDSVRGLTVVRTDYLSDSTVVEMDSVSYEFENGWLRKRTRYIIRSSANDTSIKSFTASWRYDPNACRVLIDSTADDNGKVTQLFDTISIDRNEARFWQRTWKDEARRLRSNDGSLIYSFDVGWMDYEGARIFDSAMRLGCEITTSDGETSSIGKREGDTYVYCHREDETGHAPMEERIYVYRIIDDAIELYDYSPCLWGFFREDEPEQCLGLDSLRYPFLDEDLTSRCDDITFDVRALAELVISKHPACSCVQRSTYRYEWAR